MLLQLKFVAEWYIYGTDFLFCSFFVQRHLFACNSYTASQLKLLFLNLYWHLLYTTQYRRRLTLKRFDCVLRTARNGASFFSAGRSSMTVSFVVVLGKRHPLVFWRVCVSSGGRYRLCIRGYKSCPYRDTGLCIYISLFTSTLSGLQRSAHFTTRKEEEYYLEFFVNGCVSQNGFYLPTAPPHPNSQPVSPV